MKPKKQTKERQAIFIEERKSTPIPDSIFLSSKPKIILFSKDLEITMNVLKKDMVRPTFQLMPQKVKIFE